MWDFDAAESVKEKFSKFAEIKGVKGMRKWMKEVAVTATMGQHDNELIGRAKIPLSVSIVFFLTCFIAFICFRQYLRPE